MRNKRGSEKYYILMSIILGILILSISLYFIFHEYFTSEELDWEICRQSIILRNEVPDSVGLDQLKSQFPIKCKTQVVEIDYIDNRKYKDHMQELLDSCWWLFGNGNFSIYPRNIVWPEGLHCFVCARIHYKNDEIRKAYTEKGDRSDRVVVITNYESGSAFSTASVSFVKKNFEFSLGGRLAEEIFGEGITDKVQNYVYGDSLDKSEISLTLTTIDNLQAEDSDFKHCKYVTIPA